jgi:Protein of unknown function (DUF3043)
VFRRSSTSAGTAASRDNDDAAAAEGAGKGRPTPKRRDAQNQTTFIDRTTRTGGRGGKGGRPSREAAFARREAMRRGEESALGPRDRGPVRRFARDFVDARRNLGSLFIPVGFPLVLLSYVVPLAELLVLVIVLAITVDSILLGIAVKKQAAARFPHEPANGVAMYAILRAMQFRRARIPAPRVARGAKV